MQPRHDHRRLIVYERTLEFVAAAARLSKTFPRGSSDLVDQLRRASSSIALNIAEGAGEFAPNEKTRFYRMARRSATECSAILDVAVVTELVAECETERLQQLLGEIVAMLTTMVNRASV